MPDSNPADIALPVALIGFGEAGASFAASPGWRAQARGWDLLDERRAAMAACGVTAAANAGEALHGVRAALSLVTADAALGAARDYASHLAPGTLWLDMNSVAPGSKRAAAEAVRKAGGRYVDVAVMAPVGQQLDVPLLVAGPDAQDARCLLEEIGFANVRVVGEDIGAASAIKMIRSVMVKGIEALTWECTAAARRAGVLDEVLASLDASERRDWNWASKAGYNRERMQTHGMRRAAEMEEVAATLRELGVEPVMTEATVLLQRRAARTDSMDTQGSTPA